MTAAVTATWWLAKYHGDTSHGAEIFDADRIVNCPSDTLVLRIMPLWEDALEEFGDDPEFIRRWNIVVPRFAKALAQEGEFMRLIRKLETFGDDTLSVWRAGSLPSSSGDAAVEVGTRARGEPPTKVEPPAPGTKPVQKRLRGFDSPHPLEGIS